MEKFQVIQPLHELRPFIREYWFMSSGMQNGSQRLIPSGCVGLSINRRDEACFFSDGSFLPQCYITGQMDRYRDLQFNAFDMIIVIFQPLGARALLGLPINELRGLDLSVDHLDDHGFLELEDKLLNLDDNGKCVCLLNNFFQNRLYDFDCYNMKRLSSAIISINEKQMSLDTLASSSCLSYKQFKRIFSEYIGLNPKEFIRICRFSKALHFLQTNICYNLEEISDMCNYYDKSHLIKEVKLLSGYTPSEVLDNSDSPSYDKSLFQLSFINIS